MEKVNKIYIVFTTILVLVCSTASYAQLKEIKAYGAFNKSLSLKDGFSEASGIGGRIAISFSLTEKFAIGLMSGYSQYTVDQDSLPNIWGWRFWNNRYEDRVDADLRSDPNLAFELDTEQVMDNLPVILFASYDFDVNEDFVLTPTVGFGVSFATRRLYLIEKWSKNFPEADYTFEYEYRNFAPKKYANPILIYTNLEAQYAVMDVLLVNLGAGYTHYLDTGEDFGYTNFPFLNELNLKLGITFAY